MFLWWKVIDLANWIFSCFLNRLLHGNLWYLNSMICRLRRGLLHHDFCWILRCWLIWNVFLRLHNVFARHTDILFLFDWSRFFLISLNLLRHILVYFGLYRLIKLGWTRFWNRNLFGTGLEILNRFRIVRRSDCLDILSSCFIVVWTSLNHYLVFQRTLYRYLVLRFWFWCRSGFLPVASLVWLLDHYENWRCCLRLLHGPLNRDTLAHTNWFGLVKSVLDHVVI